MKIFWILILCFGFALNQVVWIPQGELAPASQSAKKFKKAKANQTDTQGLGTREPAGSTREFLSRDDFLFSEIEERNFNDFLIELYIQSQVNGFSEFIEFLGLRGILKEEDCQKLMLGQAGPGNYLTLHLANLIAPDIIDRETLLRKAQAARERFSDTLEISSQSYERAKANLAHQPPVRLPETSYTTVERSHTTDHPFYQTLHERISKLLSNTQGVTVEIAIRKIAEGLDLHPWMLQGYMPLPKEVTPLEIASRLTRLLYDTPEYEEGHELEEEMTVGEEIEKEREHLLESAIAFFREPRGLDIANAQASGLPLGYDGMLSAVMDYLDINSRQLQNALARAGLEVTTNTIENWRTARALPQQESTALLTAKVLGLEGKHRKTWIDTHRKTRQKRHLYRREARELAEAKEEIGPRFISDSELEVFLNACKLIASRQDKEGRIVYGLTNETFRQSQQEAYSALLNYFSRLSEETPKEKRKAHIVLPGGVGKTRLEITVVDAAVQAGLKVLIVVPSKIAVNGTYREFQQLNPKIKVGRIYSGLKEYHGDVTLMTYASAINEFYKALLAEIRGEKTEFDISSFDLLFADEGHRYLTELSNLLLRQLGALQIALTATPYYHEGKKVSDRFGETIYEVTLDQAIEGGECANLKCILVNTKVNMDPDQLERAFASDWEESGEIERLFNVAPWNQVFVDIYESDQDPDTNERIFGEKAIVFCASVQHAKDMARRFDEQLQPLLKEDEFREILLRKGINPDGIKQIAAAVSGDMRDRDIEQILGQYERGEILILASAQLLLESYDSPSTSVIMNAVLTESIVRAGQRGMRGSRILRGKESWYVYDALPQGWESIGMIPVLFAEFATRTIKKSAPRAEKSIVSSDYERSHIPEQDLAYNFVWDTDTILQIVQSQIGRRQALTDLTTGEFCSAAVARDRLRKMNYLIQWEAISEAYLKLKKLLPENPLLNTPYTIGTEHGSITLILLRRDNKERLLARSDEILPYLVKAFKLEKRAPLPPKDFISASRAAEILYADGYYFSVKGIHNHMRNLIKEKLGDSPPIKPFLIVTERGVLVGMIARSRMGGPVKWRANIPFFRKQEILDYLKKALNLKRRGDRRLPYPSDEKNLISIAKAVYELSREGGYKVLDRRYVKRRIEKIVRQQVPRDHPLGERFTLYTTHGKITGRIAGSPHGNISFFDRNQIRIYLLNEFNPIKKGSKPPDGYFTRLKLEFYLRKQGYRVNNLLEYFNEFKRQLPANHPDGTPFIVKSEYGDVRIVMADTIPHGLRLHVNAEDIIGFLKKSVGLRKAPKAGYLTVHVFCRTVRSEHRMSYQDMAELYLFLGTQLPSDHPAGEPYEARDPQGHGVSIMMADQRGNNFLHAYRADVIRSLKAQGKIQKKKHSNQLTPASRKMLTAL